jgi:hypothetical protein
MKNTAPEIACTPLQTVAGGFGVVKAANEAKANSTTKHRGHGGSTKNTE